jgi:Tol biopolymer transport system component
VLPLSGERKPRPLLQTPFNETGSWLSPDDRWVAYLSNESGRTEIYVMPFRGAGRWQVSTAGGENPRWGRDGKELFYVAGDTIMAAQVDATGNARRRGGTGSAAADYGHHGLDFNPSMNLHIDDR